MSQEGYADPVTNDGPRFHSIIPISELTERRRSSPSDRDRRQDLAPSVVRNQGWGNAHNSHRPLLRPNRAWGLKTNARDCDPELARIHDSDSPSPMARTDARIHEHRLVRSVN